MREATCRQPEQDTIQRPLISEINICVLWHHGALGAWSARIRVDQCRRWRAWRHWFRVLTKLGKFRSVRCSRCGSVLSWASVRTSRGRLRAKSRVATIVHRIAALYGLLRVRCRVIVTVIARKGGEVVQGLYTHTGPPRIPSRYERCRHKRQVFLTRRWRRGVALASAHIIEGHIVLLMLILVHAHRRRRW